MAEIEEAFVILQVADLPRSLRFYRDEIGFEHTYSQPEEGEPQFATLESGAFTLGLAAAEGRVEAMTTALWLYTDDVDGAFATLRDRGARVVSEPADQPWGERLASVSDPDGYTIHLGQRAAE